MIKCVEIYAIQNKGKFKTKDGARDSHVQRQMYQSKNKRKKEMGECAQKFQDRNQSDSRTESEDS